MFFYFMVYFYYRGSVDVRRNRRKNMYLFLFILLCSLGLGYAFLRTELSINGTADFLDARWDVHFANLVVNPNSVALSTGNTAATISASTTEVTYAITLNEPGDFYEFTVDAVNAGNMDAMIDTISSKMGGADITTLPAYMEYSVAYSDGIELAPNQCLKAGETDTYKVHIGFKKEISASDLTGQVENKTFSFSVTYVQADSRAVIVNHPRTLFDTVSKNAVIDNISSTYVTNANGIQFNANSSDTNGRGVYMRAGTENDSYPIYYYRGNVNNNNVIFANLCWKIVRTTETGGVKLLYDGPPDNNGVCDNSYNLLPEQSDINNAVSVPFNTFNNDTASPAYVGYMYGDVYTISHGSGDTYWYVGPDVTYANGTYTLVNKDSYNISVEEIINDNEDLFYRHYTCGSYTETTCTNVMYIFSVVGTVFSYITLSGGKKVEDALSEMFSNSSNTTSSTVKIAIDNWYSSTMTSYTSYLEDTIWCNDRSISSLGGWNPNGGNMNHDLYFSGYNRANVTYHPSLQCTNKNDSFTVNESNVGNGDLTYPVGLLTSDEALLAGGESYLGNSRYYWLGSPSSVINDGDTLIYGSSVNDYGGIEMNSYIGGSGSPVRPSISLKQGTMVSGGTGTYADPYIVE